VELRSQAKSAYDTGDYDTATDLARQAKAELALIGGMPAQATAEALPLPASYTVRLIPDDRDCLSKIAGYPFVYGDRARWPLIYRANKATLKHPENADIILPGEVLVIPSITGETRAGAWEEGKEYPNYTK
jgi:nucleoid-associated protein YgaU